MAWPNTPLTSYVASTTPAIKAADLNSFQSATNDLYNVVPHFMPKAWAFCQSGTAARTLLKSYGFSAIANSGTANRMRLTMSVAMDDPTSWVAIAAGEGSAFSWGAYQVDSTHVDIGISLIGTGVQDLQSGGPWHFSVLLFGQH